MVLSVSVLAFDGYGFESACNAIASAGGTHVEPAYIQSYESIDEGMLTDRHAAELAQSAVRAGLQIQSISLHIDPQAEDAVGKLDRRLAFGAAAGARFILTNIARREDQSKFVREVEHLRRCAEARDVKLCFENPGDRPSLVSSGADAVHWETKIGSENIGINLDIGNLYTVDPQSLLPAGNLRGAIEKISHIHLKDFLDQGRSRRTVAIGDGAIDYRTVLAEIALHRPDLPIGIEMPLRVVRSTFDNVTTRTAPMKLDQVCFFVKRSLAFVNERLSAQTNNHIREEERS